jgi:transcriptional regulator with XRE-family HTH domain
LNRREVNVKVKLTVMSVERRQQRLTQFDLAVMVGITQAEISMIERGKIVTPKDETLENIARVLGIASDVLLMDYAEYILEQRGVGA